MIENEKTNHKSPIRVLLIGGNLKDFNQTKNILEMIDNFNYHLDWEKKYSNALKAILDQDHDIYLIDYRLGKKDGISLISKSIENGISSPLILLTHIGDHAIDIKAMEEGAADYLVKAEITPQLMERSIRYALNRSKAIRLVKEGENKFRQLFERSIDAIYVSDIDHNFSDVNPALSKLIGFSFPEIVEKNMSDLFQNPGEFESFLNLLEENGQVKDFEAVLRKKDKKGLSCQITAIVRYNHEDIPIGYQGIIHDITLRKRSEQNLLIAERLSMAGKIARSIAHEVRNPLSNVGLALEQLEDEIPPDNEDIQLYLDIIQRNTNRISQLISEMLNSSKPKELNRKLYSINEIVERALELVDDRLILKKIKLSVDYDAMVKPIYLDKDNFKIALLNVLVNAIEAMEESFGKLNVKTEWTQEMVKIIISDNGSGISSEELSNLFDPFYTNKPGGMGLGLTSTQNIMHSHGGSIEVKSKVNEGTKVTLILPQVNDNKTNLAKRSYQKVK